jgi:hypothetical protein
MIQIYLISRPIYSGILKTQPSVSYIPCVASSSSPIHLLAVPPVNKLLSLSPPPPSPPLFFSFSGASHTPKSLALSVLHRLGIRVSAETLNPNQNPAKPLQPLVASSKQCMRPIKQPLHTPVPSSSILDRPTKRHQSLPATVSHPSEWLSRAEFVAQWLSSHAEFVRPSDSHRLLAQRLVGAALVIPAIETGAQDVGMHVL